MKYVITTADGLHLVRASQRPQREDYLKVEPAPAMSEHMHDLNQVEEIDEFGGIVKRWVIDEAKRQDRLAREKAAEQAAEQAEGARATKRQDAQARARALNWNSATAAQVRATLKDLLEDMGWIE